MTIGARLKEERERLGFTQPAFAGVAETTKKSQIDYEKDLTQPKAGYLAAIARLGADVQYIVTGERCPSSLTPDENELVDCFRCAPLAVKAATLAGLKAGANPPSNTEQQGARTQVVTGSGNRVAGRDFYGKE
ncbi:XRE family transcriptional regulator [Pseudomonas sp. BN515]|uniref:helix-turn-helix domain-containing protein n=1 Tax=Pseudomonas sp. BN515 TaxID=2567892 RepID=UPI0024562798|nr:XRE family transcriptional regulator [Pseudomonas sp. BN515]MDH4869836.1 XRE family transcriptional regulator [Pseudomonas sp. BN515]